MTSDQFRHDLLELLCHEAIPGRHCKWRACLTQGSGTKGKNKVQIELHVKLNNQSCLNCLTFHAAPYFAWSSRNRRNRLSMP